MANFISQKSVTEDGETTCMLPQSTSDHYDANKSRYSGIPTGKPQALYNVAALAKLEMGGHCQGIICSGCSSVKGFFLSVWVYSWPQHLY